MPLKLMYITNDPVVAKIAEKNGVDRIWIDLEKIGKEERQKNMDSVKSDHTLMDILVLSDVLSTSELMVRVNPWNENSEFEIETAIKYGAERIMLPMWKTAKEANEFLDLVHGRTATTLLLETKEAEECLDDVLKNKYIDEVHIGLNDLHLSYGLTFMFELLSNGKVEEICKKLKANGIPYGFGGIARIGDGMLPSEKVIAEHYRLGSGIAILSRTFCNAEEIKDKRAIDKIFAENMKKIREYEKTVEKFTAEEFENNREDVCRCVDNIVGTIKRMRSNG